MNKAIKLLGLSTTIFVSIFIVVSVALAQTWVGNDMGPSFYVWSPNPAKWVNGHPKGYYEGDTAPVAAPVKADVTGTDLQFEVCLDQNASQTGAFAFTNIEPWNLTYDTALTNLPNGDPIDYTSNWDTTTDPDVWAYNATIVNVEDNDPAGLCDPEYIGWRITFNKPNTGIAYIVFGAHIAAEGDPTPYSADYTEVPAGLSAIYVNGVFQVRFALSPGADKSVNFNSNDLLPPPNAITLADFGASSGGANWQYSVILTGVLLMALTVGGILVSRKQFAENGN
jgi:hypothetical protein